jgi:hypothetical protein
MTVNYELEGIWKEETRDNLKYSSCIYAIGLSQGSLCTGRDSNWAPFQYKLEASLLEVTEHFDHGNEVSGFIMLEFLTS